MVFSNTNKLLPKVNLSIDGHAIDKTDKTKFLGIIIDNKLNWSKHIAYISGKIARGIGVIIKARKCLPKQSLITLYYSFIYPYLTYCNQVWGNACASHLNKLIILQKRAVRIIAGVNPREHTDPLFIKLKILKLSEINKCVA